MRGSPESLGLITRNGQFYNETRPDLMVQLVGRELEHMDQDAFDHSLARRASPLLPANSLSPGLWLIWHAYKMIQRSCAQSACLAQCYWRPGLGFLDGQHSSSTGCGELVQHHGAQVVADDGFANGVASTFMMRYTTHDCPIHCAVLSIPARFVQSATVQLWHDLVQRPIIALQEYYPAAAASR